MACSGLHCAGCGGGSAAPVAALAALEGFEWVAAHLVEVLATSAACGVLAVAAVVALMRWADRRDAPRAAEWRILRAREVPQIPAADRRPVTGEVHLHLYGPEATETAAQLLHGRELPRHVGNS